MRTLGIHMAAAILCVVSSIGMTASAWAGSPADDTAASLKQLDAWLSKSKSGPAWNAYLKTDVLRAQLAKPGDADPKQLTVVLKQYRSGTAGLESRQFVAVRRALSAWVDQLAQSKPEPLSNLPVTAEKLADQLTPKSAADVADAKANLQRDIKALSQFLAASGRRGQNWKQYLKWSQLQTALAAKSPDLGLLKEVLDRFEADQDGLEMAPYTAVRHSLQKFLYTSLAARNPDAVAAQLEKYDHLLPRQPKLNALLKAYGPGATHVESVGIGARLGELDRFQEASALVSAVRHYWSHPNLTAYIKRDIVAAGLEENLDEVIQIHEDILGANITGTGKLRGTVDLVLVPNQQRAVLSNVLHGTTHTNTIGSKGPVEIYSNGVTKLTGTKTIIMSSAGLTDKPAEGIAKTSNNVTDVSTKRNGPVGKMIQRSAWKKIGESKDEAESIAGEKATARLKERMNQQSAKALAKANHDYAYKFRDPLVRHDAFPQLLNFSTTQEAVLIAWKQAAADQLAAPAPPVPLKQDNDMGVRLHESLLNNLAATNLGGRTITSETEAKDDTQAQQVKKFKDRVAKQKKRNREERFAKMSDEEKKVELARREKADREEKFSITLARLNPATVELRKNTVKVTIRGNEFIGIDEKKYDKHPMSIWVLYHIERSKDGGLVLEIKDLDKDWGVLTTEAEFGGPAAVGAEALRSKLKARFGDLFVDLYRIELEPLLLPGKFERAGRLAYKQAEAKDGWLTLAWDRMTPGGKTAAKAATPPKVSR